MMFSLSHWRAGVVFLSLLLVGGCATSSPKVPEPLRMPVAALQHGSITVTLSRDVCGLTAVTNLPYRALWSEPGGGFEGCYDVRGEGTVVVIYFSDRMVLLLPLRMFRPMSGA